MGITIKQAASRQVIQARRLQHWHVGFMRRVGEALADYPHKWNEIKTRALGSVSSLDDVPEDEVRTLDRAIDATMAILQADVSLDMIKDRLLKTNAKVRRLREGGNLDFDSVVVLSEQAAFAALNKGVISLSTVQFAQRKAEEEIKHMLNQSVERKRNMYVEAIMKKSSFKNERDEVLTREYLKEAARKLIT